MNLREAPHYVHFGPVVMDSQRCCAMCTGPRPFQACQDVVNVQCIFDLYGQRMENVYNVLSGTAVDLAALTRIHLKIKAWLAAYWSPLAMAAASTSLMILQDLTTEGSVMQEFAINPAIGGQDGQVPLPAGSTLAIKWGTGLSGRSHRGRTFHVGLSSYQTLGNTVQLARANALQAGYTALLTGLAGGGTVDKLVVLSRCQNGEWLSSATATIITGCTVDNAFDSQRRRLQGRGQ